MRPFRLPLAAALALAALTLAARALSAQEPAQESPPTAERGVALTVFRSPATGVEYRAGRVAGFAGFYPTILRAPGQRRSQNTNWVRAGATWYARPGGRSVYLSPSLVVSLDRDWGHGALTEAGVRWPLGRAAAAGRAPRAALRAGVGVLTTFRGESRVNPTVGLDVPLGRRAARR